MSTSIAVNRRSPNNFDGFVAVYDGLETVPYLDGFVLVYDSLNHLRGLDHYGTVRIWIHIDVRIIQRVLQLVVKVSTRLEESLGERRNGDK